MPDDPPRLWRQGERVVIAYAGHEAGGVVLYASPNGRSLMLGFEAILGGFVGKMPVLWDRSQFVDLVQEKEVRLRDWRD